MASKPPQLKMFCSKLADLPTISLPAGYTFCMLVDRNEEDCIEALNATGQLGQWDRDAARKWLVGECHALRDGIYLIINRDQLVATACTIKPAPDSMRMQ